MSLDSGSTIKDEDIEQALILIVDDDLMNLIPMKGRFHASGLACSIASGALLALEYVRNRVESENNGTGSMYRLILLDYSMPDLNGPEVAVEIRKICRSNLIE